MDKKTCVNNVHFKWKHSAAQMAMRLTDKVIVDTFFFFCE